jgi:hypothetical protein
MRTSVYAVLILLSCISCSAAALAQNEKTKQDFQNSKDLLLPPSEDLVRAWNEVGGKLVEMAQDFPEDKYTFHVQKDQRTFAETILHVAGDNLLAISAINGSQVGPDFRGQAPSRATYKTKGDVVNLIKLAVSEGSAVIKAQGDAGLDKPVLSPFSSDPVRVSTLWWGVIEDDGEHYGQLVVYYRANNLVPPRSR